MNDKIEVLGQQQITPMGMLEKALAGGAGIDVLERLMALSERWQVNQAQRAFSEALSSARGTMPFITKSNQVSYGQGKTQYKYEDLAYVIEQVTPSLSQNGLSFRWRTDSDTPGYVTVTCILSHREGHSEENSLSGPYDTSGNKNAIQAIGSVVTYLQRYTLKASLGVAAGHDDDGRQGEPLKSPPVQNTQTVHNDPPRSQAVDNSAPIGQEKAQKFIEYAKEKGWEIPHLYGACTKHFGGKKLSELTRDEINKLREHMAVHEKYAKEPAPEDFSDVEIKEPPQEGEQEPPVGFGELSGPDPNAPPVEHKENKAQRVRILLGLKTAIKKADMPESALKECIAEWFGTPMNSDEPLDTVLQRLTIEQLEEVKQHLTAPVTV